MSNSNTWPQLIETLTNGLDLSATSAQWAMNEILQGETEISQIKEFLLALKSKGETAEEVNAFVGAMYQHSAPIDIPERAVDTVGTGGDGKHTLNISTETPFTVAGAGVPVAKHGNRAITSKSGSADVLEALGIPLDLSPEAAARAIEEVHFAFLFAPRFHPAFKGIAPVRALCAERGQRTVFNRLGPLLNPARPSAQLLGVSRTEWVEPMAKTLQALGLRRGMVVSGEVPGHGTLDELSTLGTNYVAEFYQDRGFSASSGSASDFPLIPATLADLEGGSAADNAGIIVRILEGADRGPRRDAVLINAAAALFVGARVRSMSQGWDLAEKLLQDRTVLKTLESLRQTG